jgi:hypothetical protein
MKTIHERFHEPYTAFGSVLHAGGRLLCVQGERFFAENMLSRVRSSANPLCVKVIGKRDIDRLDVRIG